MGEHPKACIRIDKQLRWWHEDGEILHPRLLEFLKRHLRYESDSGFFLEDKEGRVAVEVEDTPFLAHDVSIQGSKMLVRLPNEEIRTLDMGSLRTGENGGLYAKVLPEGYEVRFSRQAHERLLQRHLTQKNGKFFLKLEGELLPIRANPS
jgi:hypothetical protein